MRISSTAAAIRLSLLTVLLIAALIISLGVGAVPISPVKVVQALFDPSASVSFIVREYRLPRVLCGLFAGAALAVAGVMLQAALRNPLASPDVVGVTKGAGFGAVAIIAITPGASAGLIPLAVLLGAFAACIALVILINGNKGAGTVALMGMAVGAIFHGATMMILTASEGDTNQAMIWLAGSLYGSTLTEAIALGVVLVALLPFVIMSSRVLEMARLSDETMLGLGVSPRIQRIILIVLSGFLSAAAVAVVGGISFLGLLAPHIAARIVGYRPSRLLPGSALVGALLLTLADTLGRVIAVPSEIPAGIAIAVLGAPYLLFLLWKRSNVQ